MTKTVKMHFATAASVTALTIGLFATVLSTSEANAQNSYYWGNTQLDNAVSVNLNVLDNLGDQQTLPGLLNPRASATTPVLTNELPSVVSTNTIVRSANTTNGMPVSGLTTNVTPQAAPRAVKPAAPKVAANPKKATPQKAAEASAMPSSALVAAAPKTEKTPSKSTPKSVDPVTEAKVITTAPAPEPAPAPKPVVKAVKPAPEPTPTPAAPKVEEPKVVETPKVVEAPKEEPKQVSITPAPAPAPAPVPTAPKVEEAAQPKQTAALTKLEDSDVIQKKDGIVSVVFDPVETDLPKAAEGELDNIVAQMKADENLKLFLEGYAYIPDASPNQSRRMSLFRAISVRNYLVKQEIPSRRIKVRAFGDKTDGGNTDRVDVFFE